MSDTPRSVREVTDHIRGLFDSDPVLADLWISGEVLESNRLSLGTCLLHVIGRMNRNFAVCMFRMNALRTAILPSPGAACVGPRQESKSIRPRARYQFYVDLVEEAGIGLAALELELLRQQLEAEGFFRIAQTTHSSQSPQVIGDRDLLDRAPSGTTSRTSCAADILSLDFFWHRPPYKA